MNFWENVDKELTYQGIERKDLAKKANFDVSNIGKGIKNGNIPSADTAVKIAKILNVTVEYLVTGNPISDEIENKLSDEFYRLENYRKFIIQLDNLPENIKNPIIEMVEKIKI